MHRRKAVHDLLLRQKRYERIVALRNRISTQSGMTIGNFPLETTAFIG